MIIAGGGVMELVLILLNFFFLPRCRCVAKKPTRVELLISTKTKKEKLSKDKHSVTKRQIG
jgi:hypothetical protein